MARFEVRGFVWILLGLAVLASAYYEESDYYRDYDEFRKTIA